MLDVTPPLAVTPANPRKREVWENAQAQAPARRGWREKA